MLMAICEKVSGGGRSDPSQLERCENGGTTFSESRDENRADTPDHAPYDDVRVQRSSVAIKKPTKVTGVPDFTGITSPKPKL